MKKTAVLALLLCCSMVLGFPAFAAPEGKEVKLTGYITDQWCGARNANPEGKTCALECAKKGAPLMLYSSGKLYRLSDQKAALEHVGVEVTVSGSLAQDGTLHVASIEEMKAKS